MTPIARLLKKTYKPAIACVPLLLLLIALKSNHFYCADLYDGSNTINIASQSIKNIGLILSREQNFNPFYYFLHFFLRIFQNNLKILILFNFLCYLISVYFFRKVIISIISDKKWINLATILYVFTPGIFYYAYYPRMYGLINLFSIILIYLYQQFTKSEENRYLWISGIFYLLVSFLHLSSLFLITINSLAFLSVIKKTNKRLIVLLITAVSYISILFQILLKNGGFTTFVKGLNYLSELQTDFYQYPGVLLFRGLPALAFFFFAIFVVCAFSYYKNNIYKRKDMLLITFYLGFLLYLPIFTNQFVNFRHYIFLTAPILIFFITGIYNLQKPYKKYMLTAFLLIFFGNCMISFLFDLKNYNHNKLVCNEIKKAGDHILVTDFIYLNFVNYCADENRRIISIFKDQIYEIRNMSVLDTLLIQASLGGNLSISTDEAINNQMKTQTVPNISSYLNSDGLGAKNVYLVNSLNKRETITLYEHKLIEGCAFNELIESSILDLSCN